MSPELLFFIMGFFVGGGLMFLATVAASLVVGLGLKANDFAMPDSDPALLAALGSLVAVFLFMLVATQTHYLDHVCLVRSAAGCWPGGN